jgi:hypothetical protein
MIKWLVQKFLSSPATKAKALKWLRWASNAAGVAVTTTAGAFLYNHIHLSIAGMSFQISQTDAAAIATALGAGVAGVILSGGSAIYSMIDVNNVGAKIAIAKAGGTDSQINDKVLVAAVKASSAPSGTPAALQEVQAILQAGQE